MTDSPKKQRRWSQCHMCKTPWPEPRGTSRCSKCAAQWRKNQAEKAKDVLGRRCARCDITQPLVWDHINDDGYLNRTNRDKFRQAVWRVEGKEMTAIIKTGKSDRLQLLCANCNTLKLVDPDEYKNPPTYGPLAQPAGGH
jgi:hypothetical protein